MGLIAAVKDIFNSGHLEANGSCFYVMESSCRRGFLAVRLGLRRTEKGYAWLFELLPKRAEGLLRQGEEATEELAWEALGKTLNLAQRYLDDAVAHGTAKADGTVN